MKKTECPICTTETISILRKLFAGKWLPINCKCGAKLVPHKLSTVIYGFFEAVILIIFGFWLFIKYGFLPGMIGIILIALVLELMRAIFVPLVEEKK
jgi:hypothetical protein